MDVHLLWYILGCILLIGFFAGTEIAFISANKINIELKKKQGGLSGRILGRFVEHPAEFIGTSLLGVNIVLVIYGLLMTRVTQPFLTLLPPFLQSEYVILIADTFIATVVILLFAEFLPKAIFRTKAEAVLTLFAVPMWLMYNLLFPIAKVFVAISEFILKYLFNVRIKENRAVFNRVDLEHFVKQSLHGHEAESNDVNTELFENALYLVNVKVRKCMVPRNEIVGVDVNTPLLEVRHKFIETQLSKIIVYEGTVDTIVGYLHHLDLNRRPKTLREILHTITAIPEAMSAVDLMNRFTKDHKSVAWVIDEFGGTAGIVTMEDVLEEIFGDIRDEYDVPEYVENQIAENEYIFSGRLELDYLNEKYGFHFPTDGSETLSGYIVANQENIPKLKERIIIGLYEFDILLVSETRIETVKMKVLQPL
ncbi:MAG: HlyC/CorC family transporter [Bacteroidetes bacterium]|nr:HlyC/CorC family transporter [Bacteroidota bacterium]MBS1739950.1 HlyC/CorC family transporter [Bacteroidota bacterium]MBS1777596.1 HlyC/CorC family transporter [Bacteroidota bacterium]